MPASRSARAMIFAPRSWPSRPGFATTTRIFRFDPGVSAAVSVVACIRGSDGIARPEAAEAPREQRAGLYKSAQGALGQLPAQDLLVELADAGLRDGVDEDEL